MLKRTTWILATLILWVSAAGAEETAQLNTLPNGLRVLVLPEAEETLAQVDVYLSLRGVARNGGVAHLVEHLMFRSSENCPAGSLEDSLRLLATDYNGSTSPRNIHIKTRCLPSLLPRLLMVESERFGRLRPEAEDLEYERQRILGEQDYRREAYVTGYLNLRIIAMAYEEDADAGDPLLGTPEMIKAVEMEDVQAFLSHWFRPDRMVVVVSGAVEHGSALAAVELTFGQLPSPEADAVLDELSPPTEPRSYLTRSERKGDVLAVGFRLPYGTAEEAAVVHLTDVIMEKENGRPSLIIFEDEALLIIHIYGSWSKERTDQEGMDRARKQFWKEVTRVQRRIKNNWLFQRNRNAHGEELRKRMENPYRRALWRAQRLADNRELLSPETLEAMVDSMDQDVIALFFEEQFTESKSFTAFSAGRGPKKDLDFPGWNAWARRRVNPYLAQGLEPAFPGSLGKERITPILEEAASLELGQVETLELSNGIPVHVMKTPNSEWANLGSVKTFSISEEQSELMLLYSRLIDYGYDNKGSRIKPEGQEPKWGTSVEVEVNSLAVTAQGSAENLDDIAATFHKRLTVSRLRPYGLKWYREEYDDWSEHYREHPYYRAMKLAGEVHYGANPPFIGCLVPGKKTVQKNKIGQFNDLHWRLNWTGNVQLFLTGAVDVEMVDQVLEPVFSDMRPAEPGTYAPQAVASNEVRGGIVVDEGSDVAVALWIFPPRALDQDPALGRMDLEVLANLFETRLNHATNVAQLDSVHAWAGFRPVGHSALPMLWVTSPARSAELVMQILRDETERLKTQPPDEDEEAFARLQVAGSLVEDLQGSRSGRNLLMEYAEFGLSPGNPLTEVAHREYGILGACAADVFTLEHYAWIIMGDPKLPEIKKLGPVLD